MITSLKSKKVCCLIIGMHNSGTSLLGGLLNTAGIPMGNQLLMKSKIAENLRPKYDYFEDKEVVDLQDKMLLKIQRHWSSYKGSYPLSLEDSKIHQSFRNDLTNIIRKRLKNKNLWAVKDPRIGVLLQDWIMVLNELKLGVKILIVHRDPLTNMISFSQKGQVPMMWSEALWQRTYINTIKSNKCLLDSQIFITRFEDLLRKPESIMKEISKFLNFKHSNNLNQKLDEFVDRTLPTKVFKGNPYVLSEESLKLNDLLNSKNWNSPLPAEESLISWKISSTVNSQEKGLGLNNLYRKQQAIQPKVRIAIITSELQNFGQCGGIGSAYYELAYALIEAGYKVSIVLVNNYIEEEESLMEKIEVFRIRTEGLTSLKVTRLISEKLREIQPEIVHIHDWLGLGSGLKDILGNSCKIIVGLHGPTAWTRLGNPWPKNPDGSLQISENDLYSEGLIRSLEEDLILHADLLIAPSDFMKGWVRSNLIKNNLKIIHQRNCSLNRRLKIDRLYNQSNKRKFIFFGRLEERKGIKLFLDALERATSKPEHILFIGADCYLEKEKLASEIVEVKLKELNISHEFKSKLNREDALQLIKELNYVIVIPSIIENSPCVIEELLDSNLRVITTDVGGIKEMIATSDWKWLSKANANELSKHFVKVMETDEKSAYLLNASIPYWKIKLTWQAFHERIISRNLNEETDDQIKISKVKKSIEFTKRFLRKINVIRKSLLNEN